MSIYCLTTSFLNPVIITDWLWGSVWVYHIKQMWLQHVPEDQLYGQTAISFPVPFTNGIFYTLTYILLPYNDHDMKWCFLKCGEIIPPLGSLIKIFYSWVCSTEQVKTLNSQWDLELMASHAIAYLANECSGTNSYRVDAKGFHVNDEEYRILW